MFSRTRKQWREMLQAIMPATASPKRPRKGPPQKRPFHFDVPGVGEIVVRHFTRSEARAELKRRLGMARLPSGMRVAA